LSTRSRAPNWARELERFLLGDADATPDVATLQALGLSGHAYARLPSHPHRDILRERYHFCAARHLAARAVLAALLRAWEGEQIQAVVFKGFMLAEFVYPSAGQRAYADVDLLIDPGQVPHALELAAGLGWQTVWRADVTDDVLAVHGAEYTGHEVGQIRHPGVDLAIDLHRRVVHNSHNRLPAHHSAERLTAAFREAAHQVRWEGTTISVPAPADAVVFGLALNRCWGSDAWWVKPRDYADFEALSERYEITPRTVMERAVELGVARTVGIYLRRCDPTQRRLDLRRPSWWNMRWWNLLATRERGPYDVANSMMALVETWGASVALLQMLPVARRAARHARAGRVPQDDDLPGSAKAPRGALGAHRWRSLRRAIHRALRLLRVDARDYQRAMAFAAHEVMRAHGLPVTLEHCGAEAGGTTDVRLTLYGRVVEPTGSVDEA